MTKELLIQKAYGVYFPAFEEIIDSDGWFNIEDTDESIGIDLNTYSRKGSSHFRPRELDGLEDNNGWNIINNYYGELYKEHGLPTEAGSYRFIEIGGKEYKTIYFTNDQQCLMYYTIRYSHWQPVPDPIKYPLY